MDGRCDARAPQRRACASGTKVALALAENHPLTQEPPAAVFYAQDDCDLLCCDQGAINCGSACAAAVSAGQGMAPDPLILRGASIPQRMMISYDPVRNDHQELLTYRGQLAYPRVGI